MKAGLKKSYFRKYHLILFVFFSLFSSFSISAQTNKVFSPNTLEKIIESEQSFKQEQITSIQLAPTGNYDVVYQRLAVGLNPEVVYIQGNVTTYFKPLLASIASVAFDLTDSLEVDSVCYHQIKVTAFTQTKDVLQINFPSPVSQLDSISVFYHGIPPRTGFGSFNRSYHDSVPVLWTLSEPYGARDWWPCKMTLTDKIDSIDIFVTTLSKYKAGSNGLLVETLQANDTCTYHWKHRYPIATYLVGIAVTNYSEFSDTAHCTDGDVTILNYVYPEKLSEWKADAPSVVKFMEFYSQKFGAYPFQKEKYGQAQFEWGGGMEHQTMSFVVNSSFELAAHEMAHQWFGDKLTCGSWQDIWLNEGFATYLSGLCYENIAPEWWMAFKQDRLSKVVRKPNGTLLCDDTTNVGRIFDGQLSYSKGAYLLHMLRWKLGDAKFFQAIYNYVNDPQLVYSFTKTALLQKHLENVSGENLTPFFDDWYYGQGYPTYELEWAQDKNHKLDFQLVQSTSDTSVSFFVMPVPIQFKGEGKDSTIVIQHTFSGQKESVALPFKIDSVFIDPELWLVSANNTVRRVPEIDKDNFLILFPNPCKDELKVWYDSRDINKLSYQLFDAMGRKILEQKVEVSSDVISVNTSGFSSGVYCLKLLTDKGTFTKKVVRE